MATLIKTQSFSLSTMSVIMMKMLIVRRKTGGCVTVVITVSSLRLSPHSLQDTVQLFHPSFPCTILAHPHPQASQTRHLKHEENCQNQGLSPRVLSFQNPFTISV